MGPPVRLPQKSQDVIDNNKGQSIDAFEAFWRKYHGGGMGYLDDLATAARGRAKALDKLADQMSARWPRPNSLDWPPDDDSAAKEELRMIAR